MLKIENFSKTYKGGKKACDNVCIEVNAGDIYGFIGRNGAGKTTTIKAVCQVLDFSEGTIYIDGLNIKNYSLEAKKKVAYIPDNPDLYDFLTGNAYLNFISDMYDVSSKRRNELIHKYASLLELTSNLGDSISTYSHGMKQKLAIISALIHEPKLMILDEPFVGLDPKATQDLKSIMKEMCKNGCAIFFSTHILEVAEKLCNKVAIIQNGRIVVSGQTSDITCNSSLESVFLGLIANE